MMRSEAALDGPIVPDREAEATAVLPWVPIGWGIGSIGIAVAAITVNIMLLAFMVTVLGVEPSIAGAIVAVVRVSDILLDIAVGTLSDRTRSRWGRRRPWLLAGSICCATSLTLLFSPPALGPGLSLPLYLGAMLVFFYGAYSMFTVPYMAMPVDMTDSSRERTTLMSVRAAFLSVGGLIAVGLGPSLIGWFGRGRDAYAHMALAMSAVIFVAMFTSFVATAGTRAVPPGNGARPRLTLDVFRTRSFTWLLVSKFMVLFAISINATMMMIFHGIITARGPAGVASFGLVSGVTSLLCLPIWLKLARRVEKRRLYMTAIAIFAVAMLSWSLSNPLEPDAIFYLRALATGSASGAISFLSGAMLPEAAEDDFARTGLRREGTLAGLFIATEKTAFACAPLVAGIILSASGFKGGLGTSVAIVQSPGAVSGIVVAAAVAPALAALIGLLPALGVPLSRGRADRAVGRDPRSAMQGKPFK